LPSANPSAIRGHGHSSKAVARGQCADHGATHPWALARLDRVRWRARLRRCYARSRSPLSPRPRAHRHLPRTATPAAQKRFAAHGAPPGDSADKPLPFNQRGQFSCRQGVSSGSHLIGPGKARWVCEQALQQLKEELGLDHFEGRSWVGLHRHALMTLVAYAFLQHRRLTSARRKKRINGPPPQPSLPAVRHAIVSLFIRSPSRRCPHCRTWIETLPRRK